MYGTLSSKIRLQGESLEDRHEVQYWVVKKKGTTPVHTSCEKRSGGPPMCDSPTKSKPNTFPKMPPSVLDEFPSTPGKVCHFCSHLFSSRSLIAYLLSRSSERSGFTSIFPSMRLVRNSEHMADVHASVGQRRIPDLHDLGELLTMFVTFF